MEGHRFASASCVIDMPPGSERIARTSVTQDAGDTALDSDDGPIFSTVAKLVEALERSIPEGSQNAERKKEALRLGRELLRGTKYEE